MTKSKATTTSSLHLLPRLWVWLSVASWMTMLIPLTVHAQSPGRLTLSTARELWTNLTRGLPSDYTFAYGETSSSGMNNGGDGGVGVRPSFEDIFIVDVRSDVATNVYSRTDPFRPDRPDPSDFPTVPELFALIEEAQSTALLEPIVEYDRKYGYPTVISIVYSASDMVVMTVSAMTPFTILEYELNSQVALWESFAEATEDYSFISRTVCFCFQEYITPKQIVVENTTVVSTLDVETGQQSESVYDTVPQLFQRIQGAIDSFYVIINVTYDGEIGYPTRVYTNPEYGLADGDLLTEITNLTLAEGTPVVEGDGEEAGLDTASPEPTPMPTTAAPALSPPRARLFRQGTRLCSSIFQFFRLCQELEEEQSSPTQSGVVDDGDILP